MAFADPPVAPSDASTCSGVNTKARGIISPCHTFLSSEGTWIESERRESCFGWLSLRRLAGIVARDELGRRAWPRPTMRRTQRNGRQCRFRPRPSNSSRRGSGRSWSTSASSATARRKQSSGLRLDSREAVLKGGDSGPAVVPAEAEESLLIQAVAHTHAELKMPPSGKLSRPGRSRSCGNGLPWVRPGPSARPRACPAGGDGASSPAAVGSHWAFQPVRRAAPPPVNNRRWVSHASSTPSSSPGSRPPA